MSRRILFVVEGKRAEPRFLKKILGSYDIAEEHQIYSVTTNIHVVYNRLFSMDEEEDIDLLNSLKEVASEEDRHTLSGKYSDIYLIFDAEVQDPKWNPEHIKRMLEHFDNPTENGLLLLNYPMFESIRHMECPWDEKYLSSTVSKEGIGRYKELVGSEGCLELRDPNRYTKGIIGMLLHMNVWKLCVVLEGQKSIPDYSKYSSNSLVQLFDIQKELLYNHDEIYVINTSIMIILEFIDPIVLQ